MLESFGTWGGLRSCLPGISLRHSRGIQETGSKFYWLYWYSHRKILFPTYEGEWSCKLHTFSQNIHKAVTLPYKGSAWGHWPKGPLQFRDLIVQNFFFLVWLGGFFNSQSNEKNSVAYVGLSSTDFLWKGQKPRVSPSLIWNWLQIPFVFAIPVSSDSQSLALWFPEEYAMALGRKMNKLERIPSIC